MKKLKRLSWAVATTLGVSALVPSAGAAVASSANATLVLGGTVISSGAMSAGGPRLMLTLMLPATPNDTSASNASINLLSTSVSLDTDGDGIDDYVELRVYGTNPRRADTDGDGLPDGYEVGLGFDPVNTDESSADPDADGLTNLQEYTRGTDPMKRDTDNDGISDGDEVAAGQDPLNGNDCPSWICGGGGWRVILGTPQ